MVGMALVTASVTCGAPSQKSTYAAKADDSSITSNGNRFFRSGTAVLQGRIEGKLPDGIIYYGYDGVTGESKPKAYSVNADGTFTVTFDLDYPILDYIMVGDDAGRQMPNNTLTRAELAQILFNLSQLVK